MCRVACDKVRLEACVNTVQYVIREVPRKYTMRKRQVKSELLAHAEQQRFETRARRLTDTVQRRTLVQQLFGQLSIGDGFLADALDVVVIDTELDLGRDFVYGTKLDDGVGHRDQEGTVARAISTHPALADVNFMYIRSKRETHSKLEIILAKQVVPNAVPEGSVLVQG